MPKLFEAVKTRDLKELKRLKENGVDLSQRDKDGNTPLLWAACYGYLDIVKWLRLKEGGGSTITEANKLGNTALLLAVSYGHLAIVEWLLREGGAQLTETNTIGNSPLLLAINYDHLAIVDHLVRNYYLETDFKLNFTPKNKAISFYLKLVNLLHSSDVNYTELNSLLDNASTQLKGNELAFLHFLYLWIEISHQSNKSTDLVRTISKELYIEQLLPSHQLELISHMFRKGYLLNNRPINKEKPGPRGLFINDVQNQLIKETLKQSEHDKYFISIDHESERLDWYNTYYLTPLYRSLVYALQIEGIIDKAIKAPYTYHASFNQEPIVEADVAQWTAYHLCQTSDISLQQHLDIYVRTTGPSRLGYYEIIEKCLSDLNPQKKSLLKQLGGLADFNGERLYWVKNYPSWLQGLSQTFSTNVLSKQTPTLKLIGLNQTIPLKNEIAQVIWDSKKHEPKPSILPGNHPVYKLEVEGIYCKLYPGLPGINDALHYLYRRVFCAFSGLPWSVSGLLTIDNQTIPVLLSEDAGSPVEVNDERLDKLDPYTRSKLILFTILTNTEDGKRENHAIRQNERGSYDIFSVDNDQGLVNAITENDYWLYKTSKLSVKSFLFCLNAMNDPLDKSAVDEFLRLNPVETLNAWLEDLIQLDEQYESLFKECKDSCANEKNLYRRSYLKMVLPVATLLRIAYKLQRLQTILKDNSNSSPFKLLIELEPVVAGYYGLFLQKPLSATERFDALVKEEGLYDWCNKSKSYSTTITSSRDVFESLVPDNQPELVTPRLALEIFKSMSQHWETLKKDQILVMNGEIARFSRLPLLEQQALLKLTRLNQYNFLHGSLLLKALAKQTQFTEIYLNYPQAALSNSLFKDILVSKPRLLHLSVTGATALTSLTPINDLKSLKKLRLSQLPEVKEITASLPTLTELTIRNNSQLTQLKLNAPELRRLRIIDCENLTILDLPQSLLLEEVTIQGCGQLPLSDFYCLWPGFVSRWSQVPLMFRQRLANCITQSFPDPTPELATFVYNIVATYLITLRPLCEKLDSSVPSAFSSTIALAHLGYATPRVIEILGIGLKHFTVEQLDATAEAICTLQCKNEQIINQLEMMLHYNFIDCQLKVAAEVLGRLQVKNELVIQRLIELLEYKDESVRIASAKALGNLQVEDEKITKALFKVSVSDLNGFVRKTAIDSLFSLNISCESVVKYFLENLHHSNWAMRVGAANALGSLQMKKDFIVNALLKALEDKDWAVRAAAANALGSLHVKNDFISQALRMALGDKNSLVSQAAAKSWLSLQLKADCIAHTLIRALEDNAWPIREAAVEALSMLEPFVKSLIMFLKYESLGSKAAIKGALLLKSENFFIVREVMRILEDEDWPFHIVESKVFGSPQIIKDSIIQALINASKDEKLDVRKKAIVALYSLQNNNEPLQQVILSNRTWTVKELLESLVNENLYIRLDAANAAGVLQVKDEKVIQALLNVIGDIWEVRQAAAKALVACLQQPEDYLNPKFAELITTFKETNDKNIQNIAIPDSFAVINEKNDNNIIKKSTSENKPVMLSACNNHVENNGLITNKKEIKENSKILLAAEKDDLNALKNLLSEQSKATLATNPKNNSENTALSIAANSGHFSIVDSLIRQHYIGSSLSENEKKALDSLSKNNNVFRHYLEIFKLFSQSLVDYKAVSSLLNKASSQLKHNELSIIYQLYLWMKVSQLANKPLGKIELIENEPSMHQLLPEHQTELILHMIKEGTVLKDWSVNAKELVLTDMVFDKKQGVALEQLLEQGAYDICLKLPNSVIEQNKIYFEINEQGLLQYSVQDHCGKVNTGLIEKLDYELISPLTLDQLKSLPSLLNIISNNGHTRPEILTLILNKIRFTKEYQLRARQEGQILEKNMLYIKTVGNSINYTVITPSGKKVTDTISSDLLRKRGLNFALPEAPNYLVERLKSRLFDILEITGERGHTVVEHATKGYKTFLALLNNQFLIPNLKVLHLQDCDLYDDFDLDELYPVLAQRENLSNLNLDNNHITRIGLTNLLDALCKEKKAKLKLQILSVCFNKIELETINEFRNLTSKANSIKELWLKGNMIIDNDQVIKRSHKNRVEALLMLFQVLSKQEPNVTVNSFLTATDINLTRGDGEDNYLFSITLADLRIIKVNLTYREFCEIDKLCFKEKKLGKREELIPKPTPKELFFSLISGINPIGIPRALSNSLLTPLPSTTSETKKVCKQLLNYHQDAKLKGHFITHSFFKSQKMESQPSYLFPEIQLTLKKGMVYLIANNKGLDGEHSLIGYEYLTGYGQRIFKVAHLQVNKKGDMCIEYAQHSLTKLIIWTQKNRLIAKYQADTKKLKSMRDDIQNDVWLEHLPEMTYQKIIMGSSRHEKIMNCLTYCLIKIETHLNFSIDVGILDCRPSTVVQRCIDANALIEKDNFDNKKVLKDNFSLKGNK